MRLKDTERTILLFALFLAACAAVLLCMVFSHTPLPVYTVTETAQSTASEADTFVLDREKLNINTASAEDLQNLDGIGEVLAARIVQYREENGKFRDVRELANVKGIGENLLQKLLPYISAE